MIFLTAKDVAITIEEENLAEVLNDKLFLQDEAENRAIETAKEFLRQRYDMEYEFRAYSTAGLVLDDRIIFDLGITNLTEDITIGVNSTSGLNTIEQLTEDDRNYSLKQIVLDVFKYELFQRVAPRQLSEIVADRFDRALEKLKQANKGIISMNLKPLFVDGEQEYRPNRYGVNLNSENNSY